MTPNPPLAPGPPTPGGQTALASTAALSDESRPRLAAKARVRLDRQTGRHLLLYPERGLLLNPTAADVVQLMTGEHTVAAIVDQLTVKYAGPGREQIAGEVLAFLRSLADRGLLQAGGREP